MYLITRFGFFMKGVPGFDFNDLNVLDGVNVECPLRMLYIINNIATSTDVERNSALQYNSETHYYLPQELCKKALNS